MMTPSPLTVTLLISPSPTESCRFGNCHKPADLVIVLSGENDEASELLWCFEHWSSMRALFVQAGSEICRGEGVAELIAERLSTRVSDVAAPTMADKLTQGSNCPRVVLARKHEASAFSNKNAGRV